MPKIRTIKIDFWADPDLCRIDTTGTYHRMFGVLISLADDYGRLEDEPQQIWQQGGFALSPGVTPVMVDEWIARLEMLGKIVRYEKGGALTIAICTWDKHQYIHRKHKQKESAFPPPPNDALLKAHSRRRVSRNRLLDLGPPILPVATGTSGKARAPARDHATEGKGGGREEERPPFPSEAFQASSGKGSVATANVASEPFEARHPGDFKALWRRTKNAIRRYEALVPDGKPVTPDEALAFQEAIGKAAQGSGAHLRAIEHYSGKGDAVYRKFAAEGLMYAGKPLGQGQFGRNSGKSRRKRTTSPDGSTYDGGKSL